VEKVERTERAEIFRKDVMNTYIHSEI